MQQEDIKPTNLTVYIQNEESLDIMDRYIISDSTQTRIEINKSNQKEIYLRARKIVGRFYLYKLEGRKP
jgi:hypothetical protein